MRKARALLLAAMTGGALLSCNFILGMDDLALGKVPRDGGSGTSGFDDWFDVSFPDSSRDPFDAGGPTDGAVTTGRKRVFVTSKTFNGNFGGLAGADNKCKEAAASVGLGGDWVAWMSGTEGRAIDALPSDGPYELVTGVPIVMSKGALLDGGLLAPIDAVEDGGKAPKSDKVWTGTRARGEIGAACGASGTTSWDTASPLTIGTAGDLDKTDGRWTDNGGQPLVSTFGWTCNWSGRLYCFER